MIILVDLMTSNLWQSLLQREGERQRTCLPSSFPSGCPGRSRAGLKPAARNLGLLLDAEPRPWEGLCCIPRLSSAESLHLYWSSGTRTSVHMECWWPKWRIGLWSKHCISPWNLLYSSKTLKGCLSVRCFGRSLEFGLPVLDENSICGHEDWSWCQM